MGFENEGSDDAAVSKRNIERRRVLKALGASTFTANTIGIATANDEDDSEETDREVEIYDGDGSIANPEELSEAVLTDELKECVTTVGFVGEFGQAEVFHETGLEELTPIDGDSVGIISTGVAEEALGSPETLASTSIGGSGIGSLPSPDTGNVYDVSYLNVSLEVPDDVESLLCAYRFATDEIPDWVGSQFQDFFAFGIEYPNGTSENIASLPEGEAVTVDNAEPYSTKPDGLVFNAVTPQVVNTVDISNSQGDTLTLNIGVGDVGDRSHDSAVILNGIGFGTEIPEPEPKITGVDLPPTAVETDETARFSAVVDANGTSADNITALSTAEIKWRGTTYRQIGVDIQKTVEGDTITFEGEIPPADDLAEGTTASAEGLESALEVVLRDNGSVIGDPIEASTFSFRNVDSVFGIAAKPNDVTTSPVNPGQSLPEALREQSEYLNRYYASGLGSMGAHGFEFDWLNVENSSPLDSDDFLELNHGFAHYDDGGGDWNNSKRFVQEGLDIAASSADIDYDEYDTAIVTNGPYQNNDHVFSRSFWLGTPLPKLQLPVINKSIDLGEPTGMQPFDTAGGTIAGIYAPLDEDTWPHEFGHSLGPGEQVGFPDLYEISDPFQNFGNVRDWGLMGGRDGKVVTSFCRTLGSDPFSPTNGWVTADGNAHILDDIEISLPDLTQLKIGDEADYVISAWAYVNIDVGFHIPEVETDWQMGIFSLEGRPSGSAGFGNVDGDIPSLSPADNDGIALYEFGILDLDVDVGGVKEIFDDITSGEIPDIEIEDADAVDIDYVPKPGHDDDRPTLLNENETYYHDAAATTFEMTDTLGGSPASVKLSRDTGTLGDSVSFVINILGGLEDYVSGLMSAPEDPLPGLDVIAETTDGRRVGFDPDTGDLINDIDGARVGGTVSRPRVTVPAEEDVEFTVSAERLNETLQEKGIEPPESIEYERKLVIDQNLSIEDHDGFPFLDGRVAVTGETSTGAADTGVLNTDVNIKPPRLNASSNGKFVTVRLGFDPAVDLSDVEPGSIVMNGVQAVHDEQYGFVNNPPVEVRDDRKYLMVKFPREEVIESLSVGEAAPQIIGSVPDGLFRGRGSVTVFEPGSGNNGNGQGRGNGSSPGNGNSGNGKR